MELKGTIMEKMGIAARMNWNGETYEQAVATLEALNEPKDINAKITYDSEIHCIEGLAKILDLSEDEVKQLQSEIYASSEISTELAEKIRIGMEKVGLENGIVDTLSVVHDEWVKDNSNNFEGREKNYQFVDLRLLTFEEAKKDLIFVQPILEGCGIEVDENKIKEEFMDRRQKYMEEKGIDSHKALVEQLQKGAEFYPVLEGITTNKKVKEGPSYLVTDLLADPETAEKTANQMEEHYKEKEGGLFKEHTKEEAKAFAKEPALEDKLLKEAKEQEKDPNNKDQDISDDE